ncbi:heparan-alpha-glucosaminide N-acetyltransferase domain-containing protein [Thermus sp. FJN-A]
MRNPALDGFRGLTVFLMLLVNNLPPGAPAWMGHGPFGHSYYLADWVFPWFLLAMGAAIPFSRKAFLKRGLPPWRYEVRVLRRALLLFLLGLGLTSLQAGHPVFALDVLQLLALAYLVGAWFYDLPPLRRLLLGFLLLLGYGAALLLVPVPGVGAGVFREEANLPLHLNRTYLAPLGLRGLLSAVPTGGFVLLSTFLGEALGEGRRVATLVLGLSALLLGLGGSPLLPPDKTYWTPTYLLLALGLGALLLLALEKLPPWSFWPLRPFGVNPLLAYVLPIAFKLTLFRDLLPEASSALSLRFGPLWGEWTCTALYILGWWFVLYWFYRFGWVLRL